MPESGYPAVYRLQAAGTTVLTSAGTQFSIDIIGVQPGTIYISLQYIGETPPIYEMSTNGPVAIEVIPEPLTIALLGIGGLFLRRRK